MKKILILLFLAIAFAFSAHAQQWVNFSSSEPANPEMNLLTSNVQAVSFSVTIPGIYTLDTLVNGTAFTRLFLPGGGAVNPAGSPEIPVLSYTVAIPECAGVEVNYQVISTQTMPSCWVYPVPEIIFDETEKPVEQFTFNAGAYTQPRSGNEPAAEVSASGSLRAQHYVEVMVAPVLFCPYTRQLSVIDQIEITLTFTNPQGELRQNVGIFNKVATLSFINYEDDGTSAIVNDKAFEKPDFTPGKVKWITLTDTAQAKNIVGDYLIISDSSFFNSHNADLERLAIHRAYYNGFDVAILNVEDILSLNFYYEGNLDPYGNPNEYIKEQKMRTCIRRVYEGAHAAHTGDGKLGYLLLVGDCYEGNTGMPSSKDHDVEEATSSDKYPADYYFSCITKDATGQYDDDGDLFIGRLSVENNTHLFNMVEKIINFEIRYTPSSWRKKAGLTDKIYNVYTFSIFLNRLQVIMAGSDWNWTLVHYYDPSCEDYKTATMDYFNNGVAFAQFVGYGYTNGWGALSPYFQDPITQSYFLNNLTNDYKTPFINAVADETGRFDNSECLGEFLTRYDPIKGAVGYIGASRRIAFSFSYALYEPLTNPFKMPHQERFLHYLFKENLSISGELLRTTKINGNPDAWWVFKPYKYAFNLFGDPALNIMAEPEACNILTGNLTTDLVIKYGECYTIPENATLTLGAQNSITITTGGRLAIGDNATITGAAQLNAKRFIRLDEGCIVEMGEGIVFENIDFGTNISLSNLSFNNVRFVRGNTGNKVFNMNNCSFDSCTVQLNNHKHNAIVTDCNFTNTELEIKSSVSDIPILMEFNDTEFTNSPIFHYEHKLKATNCVFSNRSDVVASYPVVDIQDCYFWKSGFKATIPWRVPLTPGVTPFTPYVKITGNSFNNTGQYICGYDNVQRGPIYSTASIMLDQIKEFHIGNNTIKNANATNTRGIDPGDPQVHQAPYGEGIYLNNAGVGTVNNQQIKDNHISQCETGLHIYSSKTQIVGNTVSENKYGARLFNSSQTSFYGNNGTMYNCGFQYIDNNQLGIYASQGSFPTSIKFNLILENSNPNNNPLRIYYDAPPPQPGGHGKIFNISCNYWGDNFLPLDHLYPSGMYNVNPMWDPQTSECETSGEKLYEDGVEYFENGDYTSAKSAFIELIETYPDDPYAISSLHELFALEQFIDNDYLALHDYYATFTPEDSALFNVADFLATRCNIVDRNWQPAIDWYENRIVNPPSYQDSVFAVIDLGDIHLMMEADTLGTKGKPSCYYTLAHIKPNSKAEYEENKSELLATLPKIEKPHTSHPIPQTYRKGVLGECIPNPTNGTATISYEVYKEGVIEIKIYNATGQLLQIYPQGTLKEGNYNTKVSLANVPAGIYYYTLFVNGERTDGKKLVVNK